MSEELLKLAERCEASSGPDRELDLLICQQFDPEYAAIWPENFQGYVKHGGHPNYTGSIDAAMTLVPERHWYVVGREDHRPWARCYDVSALFEAPEEYGDPIEAATPALALCAAALKARANGSDCNKFGVPIREDGRYVGLSPAGKALALKENSGG